MLKFWLTQTDDPDPIYLGDRLSGVRFGTLTLPDPRGGWEWFYNYGQVSSGLGHYLVLVYYVITEPDHKDKMNHHNAPTQRIHQPF